MVISPLSEGKVCDTARLMPVHFARSFWVLQGLHRLYLFTLLTWVCFFPMDADGGSKIKYQLSKHLLLFFVYGEYFEGGVASLAFALTAFVAAGSYAFLISSTSDA